MHKLMTKHFSKWAYKQKIPMKELSISLNEVQEGNFEANLGGNLYSMFKFFREGKSGS